MAISSEHKQKVQGGKEHVLYKGLLAEAHERWQNNWSMEVQWIGFVEGRAMAQATVITPDGKRFTEVGDADKENTNAMIARHLPRMAATRAKGRALRDALNIGETMYEELGPDVKTDDTPARSNSSQGQGSNKPAPERNLVSEDQLTKLRDMIDQTKRDKTKHEATVALEEHVGYPLNMFDQNDFDKWMKKLIERKEKQAQE